MKKIIAVLTVISIVFAFSACSSKKYKETDATVPVTNEQGETVTNSNGEVLTEVVTTDGETTVVSSSQNDISSTSTTKKASKKTDKSSAASKVETTKKGSSSSSVKTTKKADKSSGKQTSKASQPATDGKKQNNAASVSASQSATKKNGTTATTKKTDTSSTTKKEDSASTTKKDTTTTTKPTTTKPTTTEKPKKRDIKVKVVLPFYNDEQAKLSLSYKVDGDKEPTPFEFKDPDDSKNKLSYELVKLDGKTTKTYTIEKVKGDVKVYVYLRDFSGKDNIKNNKVTVKSNETEVTISPLTGIGMVNGDDESLD